MSADSTRPPSDVDRGLPPVTPPSFGFLAQLFVVPFFIVLVAVVLWLAFRYLTHSGNSPDAILAGLDNPNPEIRWRRASDLSQILKRNEPESLKLRANSHFALELTDRLKSAIDELDSAEETHAKLLAKQGGEMSEADRVVFWRKLRAQRDYVRFLASTLGDIPMPVGVPLLERLATRTSSPDADNATLLRRHAIWTLCILGEGRKMFAKMPEEDRKAALEDLRKEAETTSARKLWASTALYYLSPEGDAQRTADAVRVDRLLAKCADDQDRFVRSQVALACNFWEGAEIEPTLRKLARDTGFGTLVRVNDE